MTPPTGAARPHDPHDPPATGADHAGPASPDVLVMDLERPAAAITIPDGMRHQRHDTTLALRLAMRALVRGVIAIAVPPASSVDVDLVATAKRGRPGMRALLVNPPEDAAERLRALTLGFDDAVPSSVGPEEIAGRIALLAVRTREDARDRLPVGIGAELDLTARALRRNGRLVRLRPMEFRLLEELARNPGRPVTRDWLMRRVWGADDRSGSRTVDVHMRWLRAKVERDPERPEHLLTVRGVGYQLELGEEALDPPDRGGGPLTSR